MQKRAILALVLVLTLMLTGCNLIVKDAAVDAATEIVKLGDTAYTKAQVNNMINNQLYYNYQNSYYMYYFGLGDLYDYTDPANIAAVKDQVIEYLTEQAAILEQAKKDGLDKMTEEEEAEIAEATEKDWTELLDEVKSAYFADTELTGDELTAALEAKAAELGATKENYAKSERETKINDKFRAATLEKMPAPTEADYQAALDAKAESAKSSYAANPSNYGTAVNRGNEVYYRPEGYRMIQQILVKFTDEDQATLTDLKAAVDDAQAVLDELNEKAAASTATDLKAEIEAAQMAADEAGVNYDFTVDDAIEHITPIVNEVCEKIAAGEDFAALAVEYSGDKDSDGNVNNPNGYAVCANMSGYDTAFVNGAMALEKVGDVSDPILGMYGYYILKYTADVQEGTVALDEVRATIEAEVLETKQDEFYEAQVDELVKKSNVKVDLKSLEN